MNNSNSTSLNNEKALERVNVLLPLPISRFYTYAISEEIVSGEGLEPGDFVYVPFGSRNLNGVVWDGVTDHLPEEKLKFVLEILDVPRMPENTRRFAEWISKYNMASLGLVLKMFMSVPGALKPPKVPVGYKLAEVLPDIRMTREREKVIKLIKQKSVLSLAKLAKDAGVSLGVTRGLFKLGVLCSVEFPIPKPFGAPELNGLSPKLSKEQQVAANGLKHSVRMREFSSILLEGVTGSGKTEVYFEGVCQALSQNQQVLVLLPEIALGAQWLERFKVRFGCVPAEWHSDMTALKRRITWRAVATGEAKVVVGARSALFLPFQNLGVIIIDEEHDQSFKQEDGVIYNARDMAVVRANLEQIPVCLVSATPSLETIWNVSENRYQHYNLPERHGVAQLPEITIIDMRKDVTDSEKWISTNLRRALDHTFAANEQALLFLNRRGYAPLTLCQGCGYRFKCPHCTAWLVEHRLIKRLQCHHCGYSQKLPQHCPNCEQESKFYACGPGVERIEEEVLELFPNISVEIAVSDNLSTPNHARELVRKMEHRELDLIIGTQIVAKGYHFPHLTLVGVIDADVGLTGGDIRALERTYQLLYQVAGRAGRAEYPGRVMIQSHDPESSVMKAIKAGNHKEFIDAMIRDRQLNNMPPFGRLAGVILSGRDEDAVERAARSLARVAPSDHSIVTLGPAPAPLAILRGRYRRRFLVKADKNVNLQAHLGLWLKSANLPKKVRVQLDIDPYSFM